MIMEYSLPSYDDEAPKEDLLRTHSLELAYQESIRVLDFIVKDEAARRLRLQVLLLEDENDELREQLAAEDDRIEQLEQDCMELQRQGEQAEATSNRCETELRMRTRELSNVKAELSSMNGLSTDSTKLLTEKLSLARELALVKTEVDHLRSQAHYQQTVLGEKLALQRQVNALEVELETEKRASKRAGCKERHNNNENDFQKEVEELRKELLRERKEKEKAQKVVDKGSSEWESRKTVLESKVEQLRTKLQETKKQVKELQIELSEARASVSNVSATVTSGIDLIKQGRKRTSNLISTDSMIGTPDGVAVRGKRLATKGGKQDQISLGEKSMFSITPYLNRTLSIAPETPKAEAELDINDRHEVSLGEHTPILSLPRPGLDHEILKEGTDGAPGLGFSQTQQKTKTKERAVLTDAKNEIINAKAPQKKKPMVGILEKVAEEEVDENEEPLSSTAALSVTESTMQNRGTTVDKVEPKKKKRKLLGAAKTIFDEDDGEATKRPPKVILRPAKSLGKVHQAASECTVQSGLRGNGRGFGAFSPLKKDRRAAQTSFV